MRGIRSEAERIFADMIHAYHHCISSKLNALGLFRGQPPIMGLLSHNGEMSQKELAKVLHLSPATVTVTLKRMQKAGLITRRIDEADQRVQRVSLTDAGETMDEGARRIFEEVVDDIAFEGFTPEEKQAMLGYIARITENLQRENEKLHVQEDAL